ncbi:PREDICTED: orexigenic neuropeptide QRFP [Dipodomys ordii]|uniref:Orexigenic neuropeptide QRFP n=1 Tax=Dipodomys ordii TaxID=10020 RepID=A0A1S3FJN9_DIPOR|nr:PREDICTED: orexigenic neuropeptide QRFP [Dipodomys ordii]
MRGPCFLTFLLLLALGTCFPRLSERKPPGAAGAELAWASLAEAHGPGLVWADSQRPLPRQPRALLRVAKDTQASGREHAGLRLRRQSEAEAGGFPPEAGEKTSTLLGNLAQELNKLSRKKGGFNFRFGRR